MDPKDKKEYELSFLTKEENVAAELSEMVKKAGGEMTQEVTTNRVHLAYEIKKEKEVLFGFMQFMLTPDAVKGISDALNLRSDVLRFLMVTPPPMKGKKRPMVEGPAREPRPMRPAEPKAASLSNQELEKKIEEILQ